MIIAESKDLIIRPLEPNDAAAFSKMAEDGSLQEMNISWN